MRRITLGGLCSLVAMLLCSASAHALSGSTLTLASPGESGPPSVAVDGSGNAIVAWADTHAPAANTVGWCVLAPGATTCAKGGTLTPAGNNGYVNAVKVLATGSTLAIFARVDGSTASDGISYQHVQEWQSSDGGATFTAVAGGKAVASAGTSSISEQIGAVVLPGGTNLGVAFETASGRPTFHALSATNPALCGRAENACPSGIATLQSSADSDLLTNLGGSFAANATGVFGVYDTNETSGTFACQDGAAVPFGSAVVYGEGTGDYNLSPGTAGSPWRTAATQGDCNVDYLAAGGGPAGFGVLETNEVTRQAQYHRFDTGALKFTAAPSVVSSSIEQQGALSQDGAGGVYATYLNGGIGGPVSLSYSFDGGTTWSGPATLADDPAQRIDGLTSAVGAAGQGWATWAENGSVFAQQFAAADSVAPPAATALATSQTAGTAHGASISVPAGTVGETDQAALAGVNAARATGTLTYTLFSTPTCSPSSAVATSTVPVNGAAVPASAPVTARLASGTYYWRAAYSGNAGSIQGAVGNLPSASACGGEVLTVLPASTTPSAPTASASTKATSNGKTVDLTLTCTTLPCQVTVSLTEKAKTRSARAAAKRAKKKPVTLGRGSFKLTHRTQKLKLKLGKKGRSLLRRRHGRVKLRLTVTQTFAGGATRSRTSTITVTVRRPR